MKSSSERPPGVTEGQVLCLMCGKWVGDSLDNVPQPNPDCKDLAEAKDCIFYRSLPKDASGKAILNERPEIGWGA